VIIIFKIINTHVC